MRYDDTVEAEFVLRQNRFVATVQINGKEETVHVKNTGRCRELLTKGAKVILADGHNPERKTRYDLITVWKENLGWVNIDSQVPNAVVREWLESRDTDRPVGLNHLTLIRPEFSYGASRVDFYLETENRKILMEVKGCTLEENGIGYFPDAPTERGIKHLKELSSAVKEGYDCYLVFVIAMPGIREVRPNVKTHPQFGEAMNQAVKSGVRILYLTTEIEENTICVNGWYPQNKKS